MQEESLCSSYDADATPVAGEHPVPLRVFSELKPVFARSESACLSGNHMIDLKTETDYEATVVK